MALAPCKELDRYRLASSLLRAALACRASISPRPSGIAPAGCSSDECLSSCVERSSLWCTAFNAAPLSRSGGDVSLEDETKGGRRLEAVELGVHSTCSTDDAACNVWCSPFLVGTNGCVGEVPWTSTSISLCCLIVFFVRGGGFPWAPLEKALGIAYDWMTSTLVWYILTQPRLFATTLRFLTSWLWLGACRN